MSEEAQLSAAEQRAEKEFRLGIQALAGGRGDLAQMRFDRASKGGVDVAERLKHESPSSMKATRSVGRMLPQSSGPKSLSPTKGFITPGSGFATSSASGGGGGAGTVDLELCDGTIVRVYGEVIS
jgi:hypothetical protein